MYEAKDVVTSAEEIKEILGRDFPSQTNKVIDHIDVHCRTWIERTPFIVISSANAAGAMDVSPKGDPPGFVKVLDQHTIAIPDRRGNHRGDTFKNVIENPKVGIVFVIPKRTEVVRLSGAAQVVKDPDLLANMAVNDKVPDLALLVRVEEAMFHCGSLALIGLPRRRRRPMKTTIARPMPITGSSVNQAGLCSPQRMGAVTRRV